MIMSKTKERNKENKKEQSSNVTRDIIEIRYKLQEQKRYFDSGETKNVKFRIRQLKLLKKAIVAHEEEVLDAISRDLQRSAVEAYITEIAILFQDIDHTIRNLKKWARPRRVGTPWLYQPARSKVVPEPYGQVLIIAPWNYPFQLMIAPLIPAIAAGNAAVLKPSEMAPATSKVISKIISSTFDQRYAFVVEGGVEVSRELLKEKFDYIFFTGGTQVGKIIMEAAASNLTPVTLELGGKSPVVIDKTANLDKAARKVAWGKFINSGQTCLAPDYILVHRDVKDRFMVRLTRHIREFYGEDPGKSKDYSRIINAKHLERLRGLMKHGRKVIGGKVNEKDLYIAPTIYEDVSLNHPIMQEEIFGPLLPVLEFASIDEAVKTIKTMPKPLALYLFTGDKKVENRIVGDVSAGGMVINDTFLHVANHFLPFGGVGPCGIGAYHGKHGFETLSHHKAVMKKSLIFDIPFRYPPHGNTMWLFKRIFER